ncbi:MAG: hypothetical protein ACTSWZ_07725 [Candidatus Heimdallarchaeaceae archaeon]
MGRIIEYDVANCPFCAETILGNIFYRCSAPIGKKSTEIDINFQHPISRFMDVVRPKVLPITLIIEKEKSIFGRKYKGKTIVFSVLDHLHYKTFLKTLENII